MSAVARFDADRRVLGVGDLAWCLGERQVGAVTRPALVRIEAIDGDAHRVVVVAEARAVPGRVLRRSRGQIFACDSQVEYAALADELVRRRRAAIAEGLADHEIRRSFGLSNERLAELPLLSTHDEPQPAPQEHECGCVAVTRITDRDARDGERPFEMRLARSCGTDACELVPLTEGAR